ncbi:two-component system activity regulator YycH [Halobacillus litoralis]|uniref:YycH family regulatory protein n=1 Tax=Halobacillus litoralis TaxID=45668 RepID=UPI001CD34869|nr:two-component system activity regulator YycH [Halobacillus litoralis]MCA0972287.1 two-component system activity regulator YycH [Halobacillus litoralis]
MKVETMKSVILVILIAFSLLLSVALWNYQPNYENEVDETGETVGETRLENGKEMSVRELIQPSQVVFHEGDTHYSYRDPGEQSVLYQDMREWRIAATNLNPSLPNLEGRNYVEVLLPSPVPLQTLSFMFNYSSGNQPVANESFDRLFIVERENDDEEENAYNIWAVDSQVEVNPAKLQGTLNQGAGNLLFEELANKEQFVEQLRFSPLENERTYDDIFIPKEQVQYPEEVLQTQSVNVLPLRNYLFPAEVKRYDGRSGQRISDVQRVLKVSSDDEYMTFQSAILNSSNPVGMSSYDVLRQSVENVNQHNGWTNDFRLNYISTNTDRVEYNMYFNGIEVVDHELATIFLQYEQGDIQEYNRPLVKFEPFNAPLAYTTLPSGEEVLNYLGTRENFSLSQVQDIKVGYALNEQSSSLVYNLKPMWFMKRNGIWEPLYQTEINQNQPIS